MRVSFCIEGMVFVFVAHLGVGCTIHLMIDFGYESDVCQNFQLSFSQI